MTTQPWLEYSGETTDQLLAHAGTHRIDSLLCAFDEALQSKDEPLTSEETLVLAVEALQREVNNGGFLQFFDNYGDEYATIIVNCLQRIGATEAADLCNAALMVLRPVEVPTETVQDAADRIRAEDDQDALTTLDGLDQRYYTISDIDQKLFAFVQTNAANIRCNA